MLFLFSHFSPSAQEIIAGDNSSFGIYYVDIPDVTLSAPPWGGYETYNFDINYDGIDDIVVKAMSVDAGGFEMRETTCKGLNQCQISYYPDKPNYVNPFYQGDTINSLDLWNEGGVLRGFSWDYYNGSPTYYGVFEDGFVGFHIWAGGDLYGWMKVSASTSVMTVYSYAYFDLNYTSERKNESSGFSFGPNPVRNWIRLKLPPTDKNNGLRYQISDISGHMILQGSLDSDNHDIDCSSLKPNLYIIYLSAANLYFAPQKFLKM